MLTKDFRTPMAIWENNLHCHCCYNLTALLSSYEFQYMYIWFQFNQTNNMFMSLWHSQLVACPTHMQSFRSSNKSYLFMSHSNWGFFRLKIRLCRLYATYPHEFLLKVNSKVQPESNNYVSRVQLIFSSSYRAEL